MTVSAAARLLAPTLRLKVDQARGDRAVGTGTARSCRNAITMASVMIDEIRLRAHARPLDNDDK